jgi:hypothetical protein
LTVVPGDWLSRTSYSNSTPASLQVHLQQLGFFDDTTAELCGSHDLFAANEHRLSGFSGLTPIAPSAQPNPFVSLPASTNSAAGVVPGPVGSGTPEFRSGSDTFTYTVALYDEVGTELESHTATVAVNMVSVSSILIERRADDGVDPLDPSDDTWEEITDTAEPGDELRRSIDGYNVGNRTELPDGGFEFDSDADWLKKASGGGSQGTFASGNPGEGNPGLGTWAIDVEIPISFPNPGGGSVVTVSMLNPVDPFVVAAGGESEIAIEGSGQNIVDGDTTPDTADGTDFGVVTAGGSSVTHVFRVSNVGTQTLTTGMLST